jgi:hypothetical protein
LRIKGACGVDATNRPAPRRERYGIAAPAPGGASRRRRRASALPPGRAAGFGCTGGGRGRLVGVLAPDDQELAEVLDRRALQRIANRREHHLALGARFAVNADLDELVRLERNLDLGEHRGREPVLADRDHRFEVMGTRTQRAAVRGGKGRHGGSVARARRVMSKP